MRRMLVKGQRLFSVITLSTATVFLANCVSSQGPATTTSISKDPKFAAIQASANTAAGKLASKDPKLIKEVNAELAKVRAKLYAMATGLKLTTKTYTHPPTTAARFR